MAQSQTRRGAFTFSSPIGRKILSKKGTSFDTCHHRVARVGAEDAIKMELLSQRQHVGDRSTTYAHMIGTILVPSAEGPGASLIQENFHKIPHL